MDDTGIIRFNMTTVAGPTDAPIPAGGWLPGRYPIAPSRPRGVFCPLPNPAPN
jgi:hypothetical protein